MNPREGARAALGRASALRARGDAQGAIEAFAEAIAAAGASGDPSLLAAAHGNFADLLAQIGRLDEALAHFDHALANERERRGLEVITQNKARAMAALGQLRAAAGVQTAWIAGLERDGVAGAQLAIALDNAAGTIAAMGEPETALAMLERARGLFSANDAAGRAVNALARAGVLRSMEKRDAAGQAFREAHAAAFALAGARIDIEHYRRGFARANAARLPPSHAVYQLFGQALQAKAAGAPQAETLWQQAARQAHAAGDHALALRLEANLASSLFEAGAYDRARDLAVQVRHEAGRLGLALPESMMAGTLGSLQAERVDGVRHPLGVLGAYAEGAALFEAHVRIVAGAGLAADIEARETYDTGSAAHQLGKLAQDYGADDLAIEYSRHAVARARAAKDAFRLANRLCQLHFSLHRSARHAEAAPVAEELARTAASGALPPYAEILARKSVALQRQARDPQAAIVELDRACALVESLRGQRPRGAARSQVISPFRAMHRDLARLLRQAGDARRAFDTLQRDKGRRLIDVRAASEPALTDAPASLAETAVLLRRLGGEASSVLVDFAVEEDGISAFVVDGNEVRAVHVEGDPAALDQAQRGDARERERRAIDLCTQPGLIADLAAAVQRAAGADKRLLLVPDQALHNLPLHLATVGGKPWCEQSAIGYLAAAAALRLCGRHGAPRGRSLVAGDSHGDLPGARAECLFVADVLGTRALVGDECSWEAVRRALESAALHVVHLAVHGRGDVARGGRASVLLASGRKQTAWVPFDQLAGAGWDASLVVFSGCSTAVAGLRHGRDFLSVAGAAAETGAGAVIGCLWPVGDEAAQAFMKAFYGELVPALRSGPVDLRVVLGRARSAVLAAATSAPRRTAKRRDGRLGEAEAQKDAMLDWGPFIVAGDPILGRRDARQT